MNLPTPRAANAYRAACNELKVEPKVLMEKTGTGGHLYRGGRNRLSLLREKVFAKMREPGPGGEVLSYPDIAAVVGCNHSTIVTAVRRYERRQAEAKNRNPAN